MHRKAFCLVFVTFLAASGAFVAGYHTSEATVTGNQVPTGSLDFFSLTKTFGDSIPVVVRFNQPMSAQLKNTLRVLDLTFCLGSADASHVGPFYLIQGSPGGLTTLQGLGVISEVAPQTPSHYLESPRDLSIPEIGADAVWNLEDYLGSNVTGEGILIADLDSGVDWRHPDLWFPSANRTYSWLESGPPDATFTNGTDGVDLDDDGVISADEVLYCLDLDQNGQYNTRFEWVWADTIGQNAFPDYGEPFFVVNDTSGNGLLDLGEPLTELNQPKTKYIFEKDPLLGTVRMWERNVNLTWSSHRDDSAAGGGHGTAVAGILLGGQIGFRDYVGVAPGAELLMIRVIGDPNTYLTIEEGLTIANNTGADVILTEIGSWTYHYLDGSSLVEQMIDQLVADGIPVISPSGNLGGKDKHSLFNPPPGTPFQVEFSIPPPDGTYVTEDIAEVYITVLSVDPIDFSSCNFSLIMDRSMVPAPPITVYLHPGLGEFNWFAEPIVAPPGFIIESFISQSSRGTSMLGIWIHGVLPTTVAPPFHMLNVTAPTDATFHGYISDDQSSWTGGCTWQTMVSDDYEICWPSTADTALSVASYHTRGLYGGAIGTLASFSSRGPRIDDIAKQGVAAPGGYDVISDYANGTPWQSWYNGEGLLPFGQSFGSYRLFSGTSASGPHVAGTAALILQVNPSIGTIVPDIIKSTATEDSFTGAVHNSLWGWGKLNAFEAVSQVAPDTEPPVFGSHERTPLIPTSAQSVTMNVSVSDNDALDTVILSYYNGTHWNNVTMSPSGSFYIGIIPALPNGTSVDYWFLANDTSGNWGVTGVFNYVVLDTTTTTTTTTTTGTTSSGTTTSGTSTTTPATTASTDEQLDTLRLALALSVVFAFIVLYIVYSRRRSASGQG